MPSTALATHLPDADATVTLAQRQLRIGVEHYSAGRTEEAISAFQLGLASVGNEAPDAVPVEIVSELHAKLGNAWMIRGHLESAGENYKAALRLAPHLADAHLIVCDEHGGARPSRAFAEEIAALRDRGVRRLVFVIGGADGLAPVIVRTTLPICRDCCMQRKASVARVIGKNRYGSGRNTFCSNSRASSAATCSASAGRSASS